MSSRPTKRGIHGGYTRSRNGYFATRPLIGNKYHRSLEESAFARVRALVAAGRIIGQFIINQISGGYRYGVAGIA